MWAWPKCKVAVSPHLEKGRGQTQGQGEEAGTQACEAELQPESSGERPVRVGLHRALIRKVQGA